MLRLVEDSLRVHEMPIKRQTAMKVMMLIHSLNSQAACERLLSRFKDNKQDGKLSVTT